MPTPLRSSDHSVRTSRPARATTRSSKRRPIVGRLLAAGVGLLFLAGCADVPNNYNERAEKNYMVGCEDGASKEYCGCVWTQLEKTVPWGDFTKFDGDQQSADEEKRKIEVPAGIQKAFDTCMDKESGASTPTTTTAKG